MVLYLPESKTVSWVSSLKNPHRIKIMTKEIINLYSKPACQNTTIGP